jgi:hypothetical protein
VFIHKDGKEGGSVVLLVCCLTIWKPDLRVIYTGISTLLTGLPQGVIISNSNTLIMKFIFYNECRVCAGFTGVCIDFSLIFIIIK